MFGSIRILGIDPGLRHTGWGIIESEGSRLSFIACGVVEPKADLHLAERLLKIHDGLCDVIKEYNPVEAAIEEIFVNNNASTTLKLGAARGVAMLAPAQSCLQVAEYAPNMIKKSVVGSGHAEKTQIRMMVKVLLPKAEFKSDDMADALAIAICHAHNRMNMRESLSFAKKEPIKKVKKA